jgi:hypothetical protein
MNPQPGRRSRNRGQPLTSVNSASVRSADCADWRKFSVDQRRSMVVSLRKFGGGQVGSSGGIQSGPVLNDGRAYTLLENYCRNEFARGFKLYKLYERAAAFVGRAGGG